MISYNFYYWGPLLFRTKLPNEDIHKIKKLCKKNSEKSHVRHLAGNIKDEYLIDENKIDNILKPYIKYFKEAYANWYGGQIGEIYAKEAWVNYMNEGDSNPVHVHNGCNFSSVLYVDVPEKLQQEIEEYKGTSAGPGAITFLHGEDGHYVNTWYDFKPEVGDLYIFPYNLRHFVHPYKSKCERVSVAINFGVREEKLKKYVYTEDEEYLEELKNKL